MSRYSRLSLIEVYSLPYLTYLQLRRDAFIDALSQTEDGTEYLNQAWRMAQTEPDRPRLRQKLKRKEESYGQD